VESILGDRNGTRRTAVRPPRRSEVKKGVSPGKKREEDEWEAGNQSQAGLETSYVGERRDPSEGGSGGG